MLKFFYIKAILVLIGFMILAGPETVFAESSRAVNGGSAQVHVRFKVVIAPSLSMNPVALSSYDVITESNSSRTDPAIMPLNRVPSSSLANLKRGNFVIAEWPETEKPGFQEQGVRKLVLCSP